MKTIVVPLIFTICCSDVFSQEPMIEWSKLAKLTWSDFKAEADRSNPFLAQTFAGFGYKYKFNSDSLQVETSANFKPNKSWVKKSSDALLAHEQLHFDIAEYYRRVFLNRIFKLNLSPASAKQQITSTYEQTLLDLRAEQKKYDEETNHSIDKNKQEEWRIRYVQKLNETFEKKEIRMRFTR